MAAMIEVKCKQCKTTFMARVADVKRGWGRFCSKSCKAKKQEARTGQHSDYIHRKRRISNNGDGLFNDAHLFSNEEHDCNKD